MKNSILLLLVLELFGCLTLASTFTPHSKSYFAQLSLRVKERRDKKGDPCKKIDQRTNTPFISKSNHMTLSSKVSSTDSKQLEDKSGLRIIISGAPASGKGTQCEMIKEKYDVVHLSTGDMLRAAVAARTDVGIQAKDYMDSGNLVPDDVIIGIVRDRLNEDDCKQKGWLLDGFPRTAAQADALAEAGVCVDCFIFLNVADEALVDRVVGRRTDPLTGKIYHMTYSPPEDEDITARLTQRSDDTEEKVKVRLAQFHANVDAVKGKYSDIAIDIDGSAKPTDVTSAISLAIEAQVFS